MALTEKKTTKEKKTQVPGNANISTQIPTEKQVVEQDTSVEKNVEFDGDISLSSIRKKRFRIDGDNNRYLEIDTSDMGIITRLDNLYPKLQKLAQDASAKQLDKQDAGTESAFTKISQMLIKIDAQMRQIIDEIFDSNVSEVCAPSGTMFDPFNGEFRYEHILDVITKLYEANINSEFKKMSARMKQRTAKYTKGR